MVKQLENILLLVEDKVRHLQRNRHKVLFTATLREMREKKEYAWIDEPLVHTLYKNKEPKLEQTTPQILFLTMPPHIIHHGATPNAQQQEPTRVVEFSYVSDLVAPAAGLGIPHHHQSVNGHGAAHQWTQAW
jgi:hypothetical protein